MRIPNVTETPLLIAAVETDDFAADRPAMDSSRPTAWTADIARSELRRDPAVHQA